MDLFYCRKITREFCVLRVGLEFGWCSSFSVQVSNLYCIGVVSGLGWVGVRKSRNNRWRRPTAVYFQIWIFRPRLSCMLSPTCSRAIGSAFCVSSLPCLGGALLLGIDVVKACVSMLLLLPSVDELLVSDVSLMHIRVHLFFQATMVGILILKLAYYQAGLVLLLMVLTYFAKSSLRGSYEPAALSLPLEIAKVRTCLELDRLPTTTPKGRTGKGQTVGSAPHVLRCRALGRASDEYCALLPPSSAPVGAETHPDARHLTHPILLVPPSLPLTPHYHYPPPPPTLTLLRCWTTWSPPGGPPATTTTETTPTPARPTCSPASRPSRSRGRSWSGITRQISTSSASAVESS